MDCMILRYNENKNGDENEELIDNYIENSDECIFRMSENNLFLH